MSRLDARWPLATAPWAPGCGGYAVHACRRVAIYDDAIGVSLAAAHTLGGAPHARRLLGAMDAMPESERVAIRAVLDALGLAAPVVGVCVGAILDARHEQLAHEAACHDPHCLHRAHRARA